MATPQDFSLNIKEESSYGTYVAPTRALEYLDGTELDVVIEFYEGMGLKSGNRAALVDRSVETVRGVEGKVAIEALTKGLGVILDAAAGDSTVTNVSGSTYQHIFFPGDAPASLTIQQGVPQTTAGTVDVYSYLGCMIPSYSFTLDRNGQGQFEFDIVGRNVTTAESLASLTYPSGAIPYTFKDASFEYGGTVTAPTTTALASSSASNSTDVYDFSVTIDNKLNVDRRNFGSAGLRSKPIVGGYREITGKFTAEYEGTSMHADFLANTTRGLILTMESTATALSSGNATLQFVAPAAKIRSAPVKSNNGDIVAVEYSFTVLQSSSFTYPYWWVLRTADSAL